MAVFHCRSCGRELKDKQKRIVFCPFCGVQQTAPMAADPTKVEVLDRAWQLHRSGKTDQAAGMFSAALSVYPDEPDAYWGSLMCRYGIRYKDGEMICDKQMQNSLMEDAAMLAIMDKADDELLGFYVKNGRAAEALRKTHLEESYAAYQAKDAADGAKTDPKPVEKKRRSKLLVAAICILCVCLLAAAAAAVIYVLPEGKHGDAMLEGQGTTEADGENPNGSSSVSITTGDNHAHQFVGRVSEEDADLHIMTCACGAVETEHHTYDDGKVTKEPTNTQFGEITYTCTVCGATKTEETDPLHTHDFGDWEDSGRGTHTRICDCGEKETEKHTFDEGVITTAPTTVSTGSKLLTCTVCQATKTETVDKLHEHRYGNWKYGDYGSHIRTCSCGQSESQAHTFDGGRVTKEPTDKATGVRTYTCTICGGTKTETIAKLDHMHKYGSWTDNRDGNCHSKLCSCGDMVTENHAWDAGLIVKKPTGSSEGLKEYNCTVCGAVRQETMPKLDLGYYVDYEFQQICDECGHNDGTVVYRVYYGIPHDASWTCSSCGHYNRWQILYE